jgi:hypothetical protein
MTTGCCSSSPAHRGLETPTVGATIASGSPLSACTHSDWFWTTIVNGHASPWEPAADGQNRAMIRAAISAGVRMANAGYTTVLDGILGPWHFDLLREELATCRVPVNDLVLRPDGDTRRAGSDMRGNACPHISGPVVGEHILLKGHHRSDQPSQREQETNG